MYEHLKNDHECTLLHEGSARIIEVTGVERIFNGLIWRRTLMDRFVKMASFELAVYDATAHFNIGNLVSLLVYENINIERGYHTILGCIVDNNSRIKKC